MSRDNEAKRLVEAAQALLAQDLTKLPMPSVEEMRALEAALPESAPDAPIMVSRSIRLPLKMEKDIKVAATKEGVTPSEWMRRRLWDALRVA
ncbi:hypothetical protein [Glycomyces paridis]|uniref:hypothetical protein n=1 Tax=Glycomyces paridis TaxID=2126555 RepID=UPI00130542EE|nr:hypothetical protein [Glycomyces paridis]